RNGDWRVVQSHGSNQLLANSVTGIVVQLMDVTEEREVGEALRLSEDRYRDLVENSSEFQCTPDLEGNVLWAKPALIKVLGRDPSLTRENIRGLLVPEHHHLLEPYLENIRLQGEAEGRMIVQTPTGGRRVWAYRNSLRREGVLHPIVRAMVSDITERVEM